ncbi:hypothetical protein PORY_001564 [Pneumocystis oryctolagi]|uniref:Uncharacterized protein n=1 Tax=Pneumocystis oryctolagi TaxID=42067 RepID=A0ACB7CDE8_9ASCO|nr:hypothetical protein PORY_001564 [Pneumocystis oryctolagi]
MQRWDERVWIETPYWRASMTLQRLADGSVDAEPEAIKNDFAVSKVPEMPDCVQAPLPNQPIALCTSSKASGASCLRCLPCLTPQQKSLSSW